MNANPIPLARAALCACGAVFHVTDKVCPTCGGDSFTPLEKLLNREPAKVTSIRGCAICGIRGSLVRYAEGGLCDSCEQRATTVAVVMLVDGKRFTRLLSSKRPTKAASNG